MRATLLHGLAASALTLAVYAWGLDRVPPYLLHDEIKGALQSQALVETGRDLNGRFLPLYFQEPGFTVGRDPASIYFTALVLRVLPLSEASIRLPSAMVGALGVGLTLVLARLWWSGFVVPWAAAATLALAPGYFLHSRLGHQSVYPVPFVLLWLIALTLYLQRGRLAFVYASGAALGLGLYSYLAAVITMPTCLAATVALLAHRRDWRAVRAVILAFGIMLAPLGLWQFVQPDRYADIVASYRVAPAAEAGGRAALPAVAEAIRGRVDTYWDAFNPGRLFFTGESSLNVSTREAGILLLPVAVLLVAGIVHLVRARRVPLHVLLLAMLVLAPLPAAVMADVEIRRWLVALPLAALVAAAGVQAMLGGSRAARVSAACLLASMPLLFAGFLRDYFTEYPARAGQWFGGNIRGAVTEVLDRAEASPPPAVYLHLGVPYLDAYWKFYATARGQSALIARAVYFGSVEDLPPIPEGALLITHAGAGPASVLLAEGWQVAATASEPDGTPSFAVFERSRRP
jgi:4-amino-4-deoxy-L-arabinose transferase-like glycosyltransferase